jgi:hypothetical protein
MLEKSYSGFWFGRLGDRLSEEENSFGEERGEGETW